jgi:hypothetical protein
MTTLPKNYWFPVKTYGWGWGCPNCWQGWVVILAYVVLLGGGALVIEHSKRFAQFFTFYCVYNTGNITISVILPFNKFYLKLTVTS